MFSMKKINLPRQAMVSLLYALLIFGTTTATADHLDPNQAQGFNLGVCVKNLIIKQLEKFGETYKLFEVESITKIPTPEVIYNHLNHFPPSNDSSPLNYDFVLISSDNRMRVPGHIKATAQSNWNQNAIFCITGSEVIPRGQVYFQINTVPYLVGWTLVSRN